MKGTLHYAEGSSKQVDLPTDAGMILSKLQQLVGGYIATVPIVGTKNILVVDEEGLCKGYPCNLKASELTGQLIVGDAVEVEKEALE